MMLLGTPDFLARRRRELERTPTLQALAGRLRRELQPLLDRPVYLPREKAGLSVAGGRCSDDGSRLAFDPLAPHEHRCPRCGRRYTGVAHHRHWIWPYHLWLAERAIHCALLGKLTDEADLEERARQILHAYASRYRQYPNADNVLGPTRLFFSTYLESIWLVQVSIAAVLTPAARTPAFDAMVGESAGLIASFDEGFSNRQVWNNAALIAAGQWLGDETLVARGYDGPHGVRAQLSRAVTGDGLWYEGENYHFFALRGFLLATECLRPVEGDGRDERLTATRLREMYEAPLATMLPDLTLPARGDAPYGVSILQPRFAELWEIGWARTDSGRLESVLNHLYHTEAPDDPRDGFAEIAEQEQNRPPHHLDRTQLGWKALLWMKTSSPGASPAAWQRGSCLLSHTGLGVLRPRPGRYVSLECGNRFGGHGHPDMLHLTLFWDEPVLADFGTGSYVSRQLHWYRSTLAHNAPGVSGVGQLSAEGWCASFDDAGEWGWCRGVGRDLAGRGSAVTRTVVVGPHYVVDVVEIESTSGVSFDLPVHVLPGIDVALSHGARPCRGAAAPGRGREYDALSAVLSLDVGRATGTALACGKDITLYLVPRAGESLFLADAPGPSDAFFADGVPLRFLIRRAIGAGAWIQCYARRDAMVSHVAQVDGAIHVSERGGTTHIRLGDRECHIEAPTRGPIRLSGEREAPAVSRKLQVEPSVVIPCPLLSQAPLVATWVGHVPSSAIVELDGRHYRRSERTHGARGPFSARVAVCAVGRRIYFAAAVVKSSLYFRSREARDPGLDNETTDIHSDGVQCYLGLDQWEGYLIIPIPGTGAVRTRAVKGTAADPLRVEGCWSRTADGYHVLIAVDAGRTVRRGMRFRVNLVVNEMYEERQRRAGQLALVGGGGFVYLRGDREPWGSAAEAEVT